VLKPQKKNSWFRPFAFAPLALFSFLTPPQSAPFIAAPDCVFSSEGAVFQGGDRGFTFEGVDLVPRCSFLPQFCRVCVWAGRFSFRFSDGVRFVQVVKGLWIWGDFFSAILIGALITIRHD
jgi:hypothetical protein